jgi:hypothetical protein
MWWDARNDETRRTAWRIRETERRRLPEETILLSLLVARQLLAASRDWKENSFLSKRTGNVYENKGPL